MSNPSQTRGGERPTAAPEYQPVQTAETSPGVGFPGGEPQEQRPRSAAPSSAEGRPAEEIRQQGAKTADQVAQTADEARQRAAETTRAVREQAGEATELLRSKAAAKADEARRESYALANDRKNRVAETVEDVGEALRRAADRLSAENDPGLAGTAQRLADGVQGVGRHLRDQDAVELYHETEDFVRRHPAAVMGGMLCAGWAAARFLKSQPRRHAGRRQTA